MEVWEHNGIKASGFKPSVVGQYEDRDPGGCIVMGGSKLVWDDYYEASRMFKDKKDYDIIAVNDIGAQFKKEQIQHICSLHHRIVGALKILRNERGMLEDCQTHSAKEYDGVDHAWGNIATSGGTSGFFAVKLALAMGYKKIIVCGCGIDNTGHYFDPETPSDNDSTWFDEACQAPWKDTHRDNEEARKRVRVMSGKLEGVYGKPDYNWVYEGA